jgi:hypothetical protein
MEKRGTAGLATDDNIIWRLRSACRITKTTCTHSEYVIFISFPGQQWLRERASILRLYYIGCLVLSYIITTQQGIIDFKAVLCFCVCKFLGVRSDIGLIKDSSLLWCDAASLDKWFLTFRQKNMSPSLRVQVTRRILLNFFRNNRNHFPSDCVTSQKTRILSF